MPRTTATVSFQAIELKGSLLPGSLLEQVARLQAPMQKEADYGLPKGERLRERIDAAWVRLKEIWEEYKDLRERAAHSTAGLHASARILREVLGWPDLQPCSGWQHGESQFPITHRAFEGAVPLIVRGIAADQLDKGSNQFGQEGRRRSPHSCLQECLNADDNANWGLMLTGDRLRLLHDNPSLVKPAYLTVDLELLVEGELFDEFAVLWLLMHASRFRHPQTGSCVLDAWKEQAQEAGERVLGQLRNGVQQALEALGNGLLQHPENEALRNQLASGTLSGQELHRQLLRLVYRFLFLFTAEDRDLLFPRTLGQEDPRRRIYREGYSVGRLRELAIRRSASEGPYGDLWQTQKLVFLQLRQSNSPLGLPGLGGLFAEPQCQALEPCELANRFLLRAIRAIGWFQAGDTLTRVNYRDLNTEELGSVYEGLLELHPQLERAGGSWQLSYGGGAGSDRKTTGSYYTPDQLVQLLIVSALLPVIADSLSKATTQEEKEAALLAIRVLDPACGSGHFLLAAARRLALELARIRAGDEEPSEELRQECLRKVVAHCIYGVDKNPMAVELCKVALWIEAVDPGKPLSFLDAHIQCGDSLVGVFDPKVLEQGIPDGAYKQLTGDDKTVCTSLKKENAAARKTISRRGSNRGIQGSLALSDTQPRSQGQQELQAIESMPETTLAETAAKQAAYAQWLANRGRDPETLAADLYTAAFFLAKTSDSRTTVPTTEHLLKLLAGQPVEEGMEEAVVLASQNFRFFHWHLRFGEVMAKGGFDCVLGNPPWERIKIQEKEFFAQKDTAIAEAKNKSKRAKLLEESLSGTRGELALGAAKEFFVARRGAEASGLIARSVLFPLTSKGDINLYALFAERCCQALTSKAGMCGVIVPTGVATDLPCAEFFFNLIENRRIVSIIDFRNKGFFPGAAGAQGNRFCLFTFGSKDTSRQNALLAYRIESIDDLRDERRFSRITAEDILLLNPSSRTCPVLRTEFDFKLIKKIALGNASIEPGASDWNVSLGRMFDLANDSDLFIQDDHSLQVPDNCLRLYEAKMIHQFEHRFGDYALLANAKSGAVRQLPTPSIDLLVNSDYAIRGAYVVSREHVETWLADQGWERDWLLGWRDITSGLDERTVIASALPIAAYGNTLPLMMPRHSAVDSCILLGLLNSMVCDYVARQKVGGVHLTFFILRQLALPSLRSIPNGLGAELAMRVAGITCHANDLIGFTDEVTSDLGLSLISYGDPRIVARAEIEAIAARIYGITRDELRYILDPADVMGPDYPSETFRVLKANEIRQFGEYRTQRLVLEAWDRLFGAP